MKKIIFDWVLPIVTAIILAMVIKKFLFVVVTVPTGVTKINDSLNKISETQSKISETLKAVEETLNNITKRVEIIETTKN